MVNLNVDVEIDNKKLAMLIFKSMDDKEAADLMKEIDSLYASVDFSIAMLKWLIEDLKGDLSTEEINEMLNEKRD